MKTCRFNFQFRQNIAILITIVGILATVLFQVSLWFSRYDDKRKEKHSSLKVAELPMKGEKVKVLSVLKNLELYKVALLYTFSRLFFVVCIIYIPIWLNDFMKTKSDQNIENIALIPLIFFVASFAAAFILKFINKNVSHKVRTFSSKANSIHSDCQLPRLSTVQVL